MSHNNRPIFRAEAMRRNAEGREKSALLRFSPPRATALLWVLIALLLSGALLSWYVRLPVYASGLAVITRAEDETPGGGGRIKVVAFLPPEYSARIRVGQRLFLTSEGGGEPLSELITDVEPEILSPSQALARFNLRGGQAITRPSVVAFAEFNPRLAPARPAAADYAGSLYRAEVEVGTRRVISLLPFIGGLIG